jgi:hypothetical protein
MFETVIRQSEVRRKAAHWSGALVARMARPRQRVVPSGACFHRIARALPTRLEKLRGRAEIDRFVLALEKRRSKHKIAGSGSHLHGLGEKCYFPVYKRRAEQVV